MLKERISIVNLLVVAPGRSQIVSGHHLAGKPVVKRPCCPTFSPSPCASRPWAALPPIVDVRGRKGGTPRLHSRGVEENSLPNPDLYYTNQPLNNV